jgi:hypothetical protein
MRLPRSQAGGDPWRSGVARGACAFLLRLATKGLWRVIPGCTCWVIQGNRRNRLTGSGARRPSSVKQTGGCWADREATDTTDTTDTLSLSKRVKKK